jgi:hypothetical protein
MGAGLVSEPNELYRSNLVGRFALLKALPQLGFDSQLWFAGTRFVTSVDAPTLSDLTVGLGL